MAFRGDLQSLILGVLQQGDAHGYEIAKCIRAMSDSLLTYGEGQLYPALHALEETGCIVARWETTEGKPARRVYALTDRGRGALAESRETWAKFRDSVESMLAPRVREVLYA